MVFRFHPDGKMLSAAGFGKLSHIPFLLGRDLQYLDEPNRFLRERALGTWHPNRRDVSPYGRVRLPAVNTIAAYGADLENFLTYVEAKGLDWHRLSYQQLLETYDGDMGRGSWSVDGQPLSSSTINRRVGLATEFLQWAADHDLRDAFEVITSLSSHTARSGKSARKRHQAAEVRVGRRRVHPSHLRLPTAAEIKRWLAEIAARRGKTKALACRMIIETGTRLEETVLVRAAQVPDIVTVQPGHPARMEICYGTKGSREIGDPDQRGKTRVLRFSPAFLDQLVNYKQLSRAKALAQFRARHTGPLPRQLFLSEQTGEPLTKASLFKAWHECETLPLPGFSPHAGRHTFACLTLLRLLEEERHLSNIGRAGLLQHATNLIEVYIRPVMGHVSTATTERYLDWVADHLWVAEHRSAWSSYLEGGGE
jgi:integrase